MAVGAGGDVYEDGDGCGLGPFEEFEQFLVAVKAEMCPETWKREEGGTPAVRYMGCPDKILVREEGSYSGEYLGMEAVNTGVARVDSST